MKTSFKNLFCYWKTVLIVLVPLIFLPIPIVYNEKTFYCAYILIIMAVYWMLELLPLPVTALLPVALFPLFGIMSTKESSMSYMHDTCMLYIGGLTMAIAIEDCNLHRRVALNVLNTIGTSPRLLLLGFMLPTAFLSMWISNTAACAMMMPILDAILAEILSISSSEESPKGRISPANIRAMLALSVCHSANIGGTATTIGTGPNLVLIGYLGSFSGQPITFGSWIGFSFPQMLVSLFLLFIYLQVYYLPLPSFKKGDQTDTFEEEQNNRIAQMLKKKLEELGQVTYREVSISILFFILVLLWFFRSPGFMTGWGDLIGGPGVNDGTPAILMALLLFILPADRDFVRAFKSYGINKPQPSPSLVSWSTVQKQMPWGIIILFGGGFSLAEGCNKSGLSEWIGSQLSSLGSLDELPLVIVVCCLAAVLTQLVSNVTTATIIVPIVLALAQNLERNPLLLLIPPTLVCSYGFMLPVSAAPNAMAYGPSGLTSMQMAKFGFPLTLICMVVVILSTMTYGYAMFDLGVFPDWANTTMTSHSQL